MVRAKYAKSDFYIELYAAKVEKTRSILAATATRENSHEESRNRLTNETRGSAQSVAPAAAGVHLNCLPHVLHTAPLFLSLIPSLFCTSRTYTYLVTLFVARWRRTQRQEERHRLVWAQAVEILTGVASLRFPPLAFHLPSLCGTPRRVISLAILSCKALSAGEASSFKRSSHRSRGYIPSVYLVHAIDLSVSVSATTGCIRCVERRRP